MCLSSIVRSLLGLGIMLLVAACGTPGQLEAPGSNRAGNNTSPFFLPRPTVARTANTVHMTSWMLAKARSIKTLLYVSDGDSGAVRVYNYNTGDQVGLLTGFDAPYGQCVDKAGDVYLTTSSGSTGSIVEYAHGGTRPIKTLKTDEDPVGCAIDPKTGDLAVVNDLTGGVADVQIWKDASGTPKDYSNGQSCHEMWPPGYDDKGNLFVETGNPESACELLAGDKSLTAVSFHHEIGFPGGVMWDGKHLTFADQAYKGGRTTAIYRVKETPAGLIVMGKTRLFDKGCGTAIGQPFIVGKKNTPVNDQLGTVVIGGNLACYHMTVDYWRYPAGRAPFKHLHHPRPSSANGESVSIRT
jgi:hypothetical protein